MKQPIKRVTSKTKRKRIRHFTAKDAARCIAYARRDGAKDNEIAKYVIEAFGLTNASCLVSQSLIVLTNKVFVTSALLALGGALTLLKGIKIIVEGKISTFTIIPIEHWIRIYHPNFSVPYGAFLAWAGSAMIATQALIDFFTSVSDQVIYYKFLDDVCSLKIDANPYPITPPPPNFDTFIIDRPNDKWDKSIWERWGDLTDSIFKTDDNYLPPKT